MKKIAFPILAAVMVSAGVTVGVVLAKHAESAGTCRAEVSLANMAVYANMNNTSAGDCGNAVQTANSQSTGYEVSQISSIPPHLNVLCSNSKVTLYASSMVEGELQLSGANPAEFCNSF